MADLAATAGVAHAELTVAPAFWGDDVDDAAILFWFGMAGLLAVAALLGRWHTEDVRRRVAETYGRRVVKPVGAPIRSPISSRDVLPPDAGLPEESERASA